MVAMVGTEDAFMKTSQCKTQEEVRNKKRNEKGIMDIFFFVELL